MCATCFYWLCQLRRVQRVLDAEAAAVLVHAFVTSRVDYCNIILLAGVPKSITESFSEYWMPLPASWATPVSPVFCKSSCTGWMFLSECNTNSAQLSADACNPELHSTWRNAAYQSLTLPVNSICGLPAATGCSYRVTGVRCSIVGHCVWLARWLGTYLTLFVIRHVHLTVSGVT